MHLYSGLSPGFIRDSVHNRIAEKVKDAFFRQFRFNPPPSEVNSWRNSLRAVSQVIDDAKLHDHGILLEYQLPMSSSRLDCMVTGTDADRRDAAVIICFRSGTAAATPAPTTSSPPAWAAHYATCVGCPPRTCCRNRRAFVLEK